MQSIKLARFCSSSLSATLLTVVLLPHFVTVHAAAAAAAPAGQQFPWFVFDCCSTFSQRAVRLFRHCKYLAWTCFCCPWQGHLIQQQSALFRACCSCSYALIPHCLCCLFAVHANKTFDGSTWRQPVGGIAIGIGVLPATRSLLTYTASISSTVHWLCLTFACAQTQWRSSRSAPRVRAKETFFRLGGFRLCYSCYYILILIKSGREGVFSTVGTYQYFNTMIDVFGFLKNVLRLLKNNLFLLRLW